MAAEYKSDDAGNRCCVHVEDALTKTIDQFHDSLAEKFGLESWEVREAVTEACLRAAINYGTCDFPIGDNDREQLVLHAYYMLAGSRESALVNQRDSETVTIDGQQMERIAFGSEANWPENRASTCGNCAADRGDLHQWNCDMEQCPACRGQLISCGCLTGTNG